MTTYKTARLILLGIGGLVLLLASYLLLTGFFEKQYNSKHSRDQLAEELLTRLRYEKVTKSQIINVWGQPDMSDTVENYNWLLSKNTAEYGSFDRNCKFIIEYDVEDTDYYIFPQWKSTTYIYILIGFDGNNNVYGFVRAFH